jgi:dihydrofolate reductase
MRKLIAAINITIDGVCDHTVGIADDELHDHYTGLLRNADSILYGRTTFELMKYWQPIVKEPTGNKAMDEFALVMDKIPKIVFSHTMKHTGWDSAKLATRKFEEEVMALKKSGDGGSRDILVGSPSLIAAATNLHLVDELQLCVHPVIAGKGLPLFKNMSDLIFLKLLKTKTFGSGAVIHYYHPVKK